MISVGIDIAGGPGKSLTLAVVRWGDTPIHVSHVCWGALPLGRPNSCYPLFNFAQIAAACVQGNISQISQISYPIAHFVNGGLSAQISSLGIDNPSVEMDSRLVVAIDSPSGFSRNTRGHGRATEKVGRHFGLIGAYQPIFQMSPSVACNRIHGSQWAWMLFGMATFYAFACRFNPSQPTWRDFLVNGFASIPGGLGGNLIEVFPRATIQYARTSGSALTGTMNNLRAVIGRLQNASPERARIRQSLRTGEVTGSDRADALVAALTTVGKIYPQVFAITALRHGSPRKYSPVPPAWNQEGVIFVAT